MFQVNYSEKVDGSSYYWISRYSPDGYVGKLVDTTYMDGSDTTNWCMFTGTKEECQEYINQQRSK